MRRRALRCRRDDGFTVVELVEAMALLGILTATVAIVLTSMVRQSDDVREQNLLQTELRPAVDRLAQDLRQAYGGDGVVPVVSMSATGLMFLSPDRADPFHLRRIAYRVSGGVLERSLETSTDTDGPPWNFGPSGGWEQQSEARIVNTDVFTYYDAAGAVTAVAADVRKVAVKLVAEAPTTPGRSVTYATTVTVRPTA